MRAWERLEPKAQVRAMKEVSMTKKDLALINYTKKVNKRIPRNGNKIMDERAFTKFAKRLSKENKAVLERLADS